MKAKIDFSKFKVIKKDEERATLQHPHGHEVTIARRALHPMNREHFDALEVVDAAKEDKKKDSKKKFQETAVQMFAEGGTAKSPGKKPVDKGPYIDPKAAKEVEKGATSSGWQPDTWKKNLKEGLGFAEGGHVIDPYQTMPMEGEKKKEGGGGSGALKLLGKMFMAAEGGEVPHQGVDYEPIQKENYGKKKKIDHVDYEPINHVEYERVKPEKVDYERIKPGERYAEGGVVEEQGVPLSQLMQGSQPVQMQGPTDLQIQSGQFSPPQAEAALPPEQPRQQAPQSALGASMQGMGAQPLPEGARSAQDVVPTPSVLGGLANQSAAEFGMGQEQAKLAKAKEHAYAAEMKAQQDFRSKIQASMQNEAKEGQAFMNDYAAGHIDPNRFLNNRTTQEKWQSGLAIFLGGFGDHNQALDFLNKQIDRDIDAQKAEQGKKQNLFTMMRQKYGDERDALNAAKLAQQSLALVDLQRLEAKAQGPMAKMRAQQMQGALQQQMGQQVQQLAQAQATQQIEQQAKKDPSLYPQIIDQLAVSDPKKAADMRERLVPGVGLANTPKDANEVKDISIAATGAKSAIDELKSIMGVPGKSLSPNERARAQSIRQQLIGQMRVAILGPGTVNESERALLENLIPDPTSILSLDSSNLIKLNALEKRMAEGVQQQLQARGVAGSMPSMAAKAPAATEVERTTKDGKVAIFDAATKQFIRYK